MGAYNHLKIALECENCKKKFLGKLQFKVGDLWLYEYNIGDVIVFEKTLNYVLGEEIVAYGVLENALCPFCGHPVHEEYDIHIRNCEILAYNKMEDYTPYLNADYEGRYFVKKIE